jgi:hypothetical protein
MEMTNNQDEIQKIYVKQDGVAVIKCPGCEAAKTLKVDKFKGPKHLLNVKCRCHNLFRVNLEFRKLYRKMAGFPGHYVLLPEKICRHHMMVVNISKGGFGLHISGDHRLTPGQKLQVSFALDDKQGSLIDRRVVVRLVKDNYVGCELVGDISHDKALGFYMMV